MAEGRQRESWDRASALMALIANAHRDPKKQRAYKPQDFHPMAQRAERATVRADGFKVLKKLFVKHKQGGNHS